MNNQTNSNQSKPNYLDQVSQAVGEVVDYYFESLAREKEGLKAKLCELIAEKLKQSFKNGVAVGKNGTQKPWQKNNKQSTAPYGWKR